MNNKTTTYIGIALIVMPFLGFYSFIKTSIYIAIGVYLILSVQKNKSLSKNKKEYTNEDQSNVTRHIVTQQTEVVTASTPVIKKRIKV